MVSLQRSVHKLLLADWLTQTGHEWEKTRKETGEEGKRAKRVNKLMRYILGWSSAVMQQKFVFTHVSQCQLDISKRTCFWRNINRFSIQCLLYCNLYEACSSSSEWWISTVNRQHAVASCSFVWTASDLEMRDNSQTALWATWERPGSLWQNWITIKLCEYAQVLSSCSWI